MSAVTGRGVTEVVRRLAALVDEARAAEPEPERFVVIHPEVEGVTVAREGEHEFRIAGRQAGLGPAVRRAMQEVEEREKNRELVDSLRKANGQFFA